jgi:hypothetical protein
MRPTLATITAAPSSDALKRKRQEDSDSQRGSPTQSRKSTNDIIDIDNAEHINLWMPSDLPAAVRLSVCSQAAVNAEFQLLLTETHDSLVSVRKYRRLYSATCSFYKGEYRAESTTTRRQTEMTQAGEKIDASRILYQTSWSAAYELNGTGKWLDDYRRLEKKDIRGPNPGGDGEDLEAHGGSHPRTRDRGRGQYEDSWIWRTIMVEDEPVDQVRVQWAKAKANQDRWDEEFLLVLEEMRRTIASFEWQIRWWKTQQNRRELDSTPNLHQALTAYARRQADEWQKRADLFATTWIPELRDCGRPHLLPSRYNVLVPEKEPSTDKASPMSTPKEPANSTAEMPRDICDALEAGVAVWEDAAAHSAVPVLTSESGHEDENEKQSSWEGDDGDDDGEESDASTQR